MVRKLDEQTFTNKFEFHGVPILYGFVPHLSKKIRKLLLSVSCTMVSLSYEGYVANVLDCNIVVSEFELHSHNTSTFGLILLKKV